LWRGLTQVSFLVLFLAVIGKYLSFYTGPDTPGQGLYTQIIHLFLNEINNFLTSSQKQQISGQE